MSWQSLKDGPDSPRVREDLDLEGIEGIPERIVRDYPICEAFGCTAEATTDRRGMLLCEQCAAAGER